MTYTLLPWRVGAPEKEFVYFMYSASRIKIGYSRGAQGRLKALTAGGPFPPVIVLLIHGTYGDEQDLHVRFHRDRLHGEWFALSHDLRRYLRSNLCDLGLSSLDRAEADYRAHCEAFLATKPPPTSRKPRETCRHGMPVTLDCPPCVRDRDLEILARIKDGTYAR